MTKINQSPNKRQEESKKYSDFCWIPSVIEQVEAYKAEPYIIEDGIKQLKVSASLLLLSNLTETQSRLISAEAEHFSQCLKNPAHSKEISRKQLAKMADCSVESVRNLINGKLKPIIYKVKCQKRGRIETDYGYVYHSNHYVYDDNFFTLVNHLKGMGLIVTKKSLQNNHKKNCERLKKYAQEISDHNDDPKKIWEVLRYNFKKFHAHLKGVMNNPITRVKSRSAIEEDYPPRIYKETNKNVPKEVVPPIGKKESKLPTRILQMRPSSKILDKLAFEGSNLVLKSIVDDINFAEHRGVKIRNPDGWLLNSLARNTQYQAALYKYRSPA